MNPLQPFYNMKIGVVDLSASSAEVIPLAEEQVSRHLGGAAMNRAILAGYETDALVFGTGPLTGSFAPASSLMIASFLSPIFNSICHVPFMLRTGPDMKFSGIDYLVVKGTAPEPSILHVNHGKVRILPAGNLQHLPVPEAIRELKKASPAFQSVIITGPAADRGCSLCIRLDRHKWQSRQSGSRFPDGREKPQGDNAGRHGRPSLQRDNPASGEGTRKNNLHG